MVGFANVNIDQGLNIVGAPFVTVGDTETTLLDLFDVADMTAGTAAIDSDSVLVYTGSGYETYFLYAYAGPGFNETKWVNLSYVEVDVALAPGEAVWLNRIAVAADITFKGEVVSAASTDIAISTGLNMVSYPYSVSASLNDFDISNATAGTAAIDSDSVLVYTGSGYDTYFLYAYAGPGFNEIAWVNLSYVEVDVDMPIGKGVWYNAMATTTGISAAKPY
jgi:hypothetical protein